MSTFKVGDRVRIIARDSDNTTGGEDYNKPNGDVGKTGYVKNIFPELQDRPYQVFSGEVAQITGSKYYGLFSDHELAHEVELVNSRSRCNKFKIGDRVRTRGVSFERTILGYQGNGYHLSDGDATWYDDELVLVEESDDSLNEDRMKACEKITAQKEAESRACWEEVSFKVGDGSRVAALLGYAELQYNNKGDKHMSVVSKIRELTLSKEAKLRRKYDIVNECGERTDEGSEVLLDILFEEYASKIDAKLAELDADEKKAKKESK